jgi:alcohol dehydrogenase (NADP+)
MEQTNAQSVAQVKTVGYGATGSFLGSTLKPMDIKRNTPREDEVMIDILYCGVCHSDMHQVKNDWGNTIYPCVPGHEIIGKVVEAGSNVSQFKVGDVVGVGCMIDSCGHCHSCQEGLEQYCEGPVSWTATYNGYMKPDGSGFNTFGGYSNNIVVKESFVLRIPDSLDISAAAPILCAGVTTYSPLKHWQVQEGDHVGVIGLGGLGHMAVMLAKAMGAQVTVFTTSEDKREAARELGAHAVVISNDEEAMKARESTFDFLLCTIPDAFDPNPYVSLLKRDATLAVVGLIGPYKKPTNNMDVAFYRRNLSGSLIGSIAETQELLDFCAEHGILPEVEMIRIQDINEAFDRMNDQEVRFRYVIDMQSLKEEIAQ